MIQDLTGPDALHAIANANEGSGLDVNAAAFNRLGKEWHADRAYIERLETQLADAGKAIPPRVLPAHAITPTDRRH